MSDSKETLRIAAEAEADYANREHARAEAAEAKVKELYRLFEDWRYARDAVTEAKAKRELAYEKLYNAMEKEDPYLKKGEGR